MVARARGLLASGPSLAFPVAQWRCERGVVPVTVAGPRRNCTGFRVISARVWIRCANGGHLRPPAGGAQERQRDAVVAGVVTRAHRYCGCPRGIVLAPVLVFSMVPSGAPDRDARSSEETIMTSPNTPTGGRPRRPSVKSRACLKPTARKALVQVPRNRPSSRSGRPETASSGKPSRLGSRPGNRPANASAKVVGWLPIGSAALGSALHRTGEQLRTEDQAPFARLRRFRRSPDRPGRRISSRVRRADHRSRLGEPGAASARPRLRRCLRARRAGGALPQELRAGVRQG